MTHHFILKVAAKFLIPMMLMFALYVQFHGEYGPGGGFQAGAIFATGVILYALIEGEREALDVISPRLLVMLMVGGTLLFGGVGYWVGLSSVPRTPQTLGMHELASLGAIPALVGAGLLSPGRLPDGGRS